MHGPVMNSLVYGKELHANLLIGTEVMSLGGELSSGGVEFRGAAGVAASVASGIKFEAIYSGDPGAMARRFESTSSGKRVIRFGCSEDLENPLGEPHGDAR